MKREGRKRKEHGLTYGVNLKGRVPSKVTDARYFDPTISLLADNEDTKVRERKKKTKGSQRRNSENKEKGEGRRGDTLLKTSVMKSKRSHRGGSKHTCLPRYEHLPKENTVMNNLECERASVASCWRIP